MHRLPFQQPGSFLKANLHTHSNVSDGLASPEEVAAAYRARGYDALAITDHFLARFDWRRADAAALSDKDFTVLGGAELHGPGHPIGGAPWHLVAVGLPPHFPAPPPEGESGPDIASRAIAAGAWLVAAHPAWYDITADAILTLEGVHAVEVYNAVCSQLNDRGDSWTILDELLARGHRFDAVAADDAHALDADDSFHAWTMIKAQERSEAALVTALKAGHYYSSTGPTIENLVLDGDQIVVETSPVERIYLTGAVARTSSARGAGLSQARLATAVFKPDEILRLTIVDSQGGRAWTNPFRLPHE